MPKVKTIEEQVLAKLRKTPKTLPQIAAEIGVSYQTLSKRIGKLVDAGHAVKHDGKTASYSKP